MMCRIADILNVAHHLVDPPLLQVSAPHPPLDYATQNSVPPVKASLLLLYFPFSQCLVVRRQE
jgi:hypothetical protein